MGAENGGEGGSVPREKKKMGRPPKEARGPWGKESMQEYQRSYPGLPPWRLRLANRALYEDMRARGELAQIPKHRAFDGDALGYYQTHHAGETRGELQKLNPALYQALRSGGLLDEVPLKERYGPDPVAYYTTHFAHLSRGQLAERHPAFYNYLYRRGLHEAIPVLEEHHEAEKRPGLATRKRLMESGETEESTEISPEALPDEGKIETIESHDREPEEDSIRVETEEKVEVDSPRPPSYRWPKNFMATYWIEGKRETGMRVDRTGRFETNRVGPAQYLELLDKGLLKFQRLNTPMPEHFPTREQAENALNQWQDIDVIVYGGVGRFETIQVGRKEYIELWKARRLQFQREGTPKPDHLPSLEEAETMED